MIVVWNENQELFNSCCSHRYFCLVDINSTQQEIAHIEGDIMKMTEFAPGGEASISWPIGQSLIYFVILGRDVPSWFSEC